MRRLFMLLTAVAVAAAIPAAAQTTQAQTDQASDFLKAAAQDGQAEIALAKLAEEKTGNPRVKAFAEMIVTDHSKADAAVASLSRAKHVMLPTSVSDDQQATYDRLAKLGGTAFDVAYMDTMVTNHQHAVAEFEKISKDMGDADVKAFAAKTVPTLRHHLQEAMTLVKALGGKY